MNWTLDLIFFAFNKLGRIIMQFPKDWLTPTMFPVNFPIGRLQHGNPFPGWILMTRTVIFKAGTFENRWGFIPNSGEKLSFSLGSKPDVLLQEVIAILFPSLFFFLIFKHQISCPVPGAIFILIRFDYFSLPHFISSRLNFFPPPK